MAVMSLLFSFPRLCDLIIQLFVSCKYIYLQADERTPSDSTKRYDVDERNDLTSTLVMNYCYKNNSLFCSNQSNIQFDCYQNGKT